MSNYQVLALKWRPKTFAELIGQEPIVRAFTHALEQKRLHHAYLFTGTHGTGKTTLARILAKCLNCETGVTATPCGQCASCQSIDAGNHVDLIEVDAASRTRVEETRELLDNVPYAPTVSRYKVYLIDEVHMLSTHSFNALLKTLEEPPAHVKFILATTEPQKIPVTVLSRCLQFHLRNVSSQQICQHLQTITQAEHIQAEDNALLHLSKAAQGSLRDALSLLDQAIAFSNSNITLSDMRIMLGDTIDDDALLRLIKALATQNSDKVKQSLDDYQNMSPDYPRVLEQLLTLLHQIAVMGQWPNYLAGDAPHRETILQLATSIEKETLQLLYQIGIIGRRDLMLAPTPQIGFEMIILRMLAFEPIMTTKSETQQTNTHHSDNDKVNQATPLAKQRSDGPIVKQSQTTTKPQTNKNPQTLDWPTLIPMLHLKGLGKTLAEQCVMKTFKDNHLYLITHARNAGFITKQQVDNLQKAISAYYASPIRVTIDISQDDLRTPAHDRESMLQAQTQAAEHLIKDDENIKQLEKLFDAKVRLETIEVP